MRIDFHYHLADKEGALEELIADMDRSGVDRTLLMGGPDEAYWDYRQCSFASNEKVLESVRKYPDRLTGNIYIDPRNPDAVDTLKKYADEGFRCVKMFPAAGFYPDDERFFPVFEKIEEYGFPVLFHIGQTNIRIVSRQPGVRKATNSKYGHPMNVDMLARLFPGMPIVMAHMGYPFYTETWSVAHANPNVYLDISGSGPWTEGIPIVFNALGGHNYIPIDFKRVLWGSDNVMSQAEHISRSDVYMRQIGAGSQERKLIFGETAKSLLKI